MDSSSNTPSENMSSALMRRLLVGWLPILVVAIVIYWLSGGLPPTVWVLLGRVLLRWSALQAILGTSVFVPFLILVVQSILILVAWILLVRVVWREIGVFRTLQTEQRVGRLKAALALSHNVATETVVLPKSQGVQMMSDEMAARKRENDATSRGTGIQIVSSEDQEEQFDMDQAVFELFAEPDSFETADKSDKPMQVNEEDTVFVYGNPFEGDLPEVFNYDMDLKREVKDMRDKQQGFNKAQQDRNQD